jgi:3'-phosphoadenosine 5'-phosphosulfate (PAPS) 3'-phosphatase
VTELDFKCQQIIQQTISEYFPSDSFLGEEDDVINDTNNNNGATTRKANISALWNALSQNNTDKVDNTEQLLWIVDPIDGTTNFQSGMCGIEANYGPVYTFMRPSSAMTSKLL